MFNFIYKDIDFAHKIDEASNPTENYEKHIHYFNEIVLFVTGDVVYTVETESRKLRPGDIIFIPSGKYHFATVNSISTYSRTSTICVNLTMTTSCTPRICARPFSS